MSEVTAEKPLGELIKQLPDQTKRRKDFIDETGNRYGAYTVLSKDVRKHYWLCHCDCGTERAVFAPDLRRGASTSCGCVPFTPEEIAARTEKANATKAKRKEKKQKKEDAQKAKAAIKEAEKVKMEAEQKKTIATAERAKTKQNWKYGIDFGAGEGCINPLSIELLCYRDRLKTGHPREFHLKNAFKYCWPDYQWNEWCELLTWAWCNFRFVTVIGHTRASKTFHAAHLILIDYLAADMLTSTTLTTTQFAALKTRLWGDMLKAIENLNPELKNAFMSRYKLTNSTNEMRLSIMDPNVLGLDKYIIQGVATDRGDTSAGKLRGLNTERRRIVGDEASDIADSIFLAMIHADGAPDFIGLLLTNPVEKTGELGKHCCPVGGWGSISDTTLWWPTKKTNGVCLHFDGLQSPNIRAGKEVFKYLITQDYIDKMRKDEGEGSLKWWMLVRGFFPPDGLVAKIWTSGDIDKAKENVEFDFEPTPCATLDPAFESDDCVIHFGQIGRLRDAKPCCRATESQTLKLTMGPKEIPKDYQVARQVMKLCKDRGIQPENFIMDETGNARGVLAILRVEWSPKVQGICYGGEATERPMRLNDNIKACDQVKYFVTELWFRAAYLARDGMLCGLQNVDPKTEEDLSVRRYEMKNGLMVAFAKALVKESLGRSPDNGDAYCQFGELMVRKGLLGELHKSSVANGWDHLRKLAKKANSRFNEKKEFMHGAT